jgi:regulator of replication initiation timing
MFNIFKKWCNTDRVGALLEEIFRLESELGALKIENEALKEEINNLKQVIDEQDVSIDNMTFERMEVMKAYDRFHRDLMAVYGDYFPAFPQENDLTEPINSV